MGNVKKTWNAHKQGAASWGDAPVQRFVSVITNALVLDFRFEHFNHLLIPLMCQTLQQQIRVQEEHFYVIFPPIVAAKLPHSKSWITVQWECIAEKTKVQYHKLLNLMYH